ncbi:Oligosaccharyltransferase complex subunit ostc,Oligosaccharyltransferase complex subunit ostc-B,Oligosaccharyltransferase complex subunit OSTC,Putative oligosaccharyltransferase complex subunit CG9662,Oligosaccharyltransferase complex subunit ostc-A [Lepeophtheirus salmonis]|uniref:Oligosaccharyltransferase complex subunit n=2 Tax=Lepeophtheirus salmonis TaxID=72036 RepID=C1BS61_LEPSM|nr:oligosaccharyltransferase complex subunit OSTC-like [Lepeophtheirus salmonis]ACO11864.1 UPF0527 membrane protein [Lepeophtheirus salmonis]CAB4056325.1 Oligosaccharyltransferase complex subunit ostc,Oligosaccharyltransferase complex subunit ostc-B,Oligosaccharyltransferase complex subunit OSTC,Putative oligosaccharyltransferase complex subunit CG9662,Oligosaccharyltransferase complex subunit ostc-A [Lepeophtheirus salmonis]CAF2796206.1 Oligosaccharyltransferase complex subunit ostc,Oligosaccha
MLDLLLRPFFLFLNVPEIKYKNTGWIRQPSSKEALFFILVSYFLVTGGVIYDVIVEPPSMGSTVDENGNTRPIAFMQYRINGQYILEGLASSCMFTLGGVGFILLDQTHSPTMPKLNRTMLQLMGFMCLLVSFSCCWMFMKMKLPGYMHS